MTIHIVLGAKFGDWTVLRHDRDATGHARRYICRCKCGTEASVPSGKLRYGLSTRCRQCGSRETSYGNTRRPRSIAPGTRFGRWTVIEYLNNGMYKCQCACGTIRNKTPYMLKNRLGKGCQKCRWRGE